MDWIKGCDKNLIFDMMREVPHPYVRVAFGMGLERGQDQELNI
jgi:hypothetical protein